MKKQSKIIDGDIKKPLREFVKPDSKRSNYYCNGVKCKRVTTFFIEFNSDKLRCGRCGKYLYEH